MREIAKVNYVIELFVRAANIHAVSVKTMATATTLYGVTMEESGVSKRVAVQFESNSSSVQPKAA